MEKRFFKHLFMLCLFGMISIGVNATTSGSYWSLNTSTGELVITGDIPDFYQAEDQPWYSNHSSIIKVTIKSSCNSIGYCAFHSCYNLKTLRIEDTSSALTIRSPHDFCSSCDDWDYDGVFDNCPIESIYVGRPIKSQGEYGQGYLKVEAITAAWQGQGDRHINNVSSIVFGEYAPESNLDLINAYPNLKSVSLNNNSDYVMLNDVLYNANKTALIRAMPYKSSDYFVIPSTVTTISSNAFNNCSKLVSVTIPEKVSSISGRAFEGCDNLSDLSVNSANTSLDSREGCNAIIETATNTLIVGTSNTIIPNTVAKIGNSAFWYCKNLNSIDIPKSVTSISDYSFEHCSALKDIYVHWSTPINITPYYVFGSVNLSDITLHVPYGKDLVYEKSSSWNSFGRIIALDPETIACTSISLNKTGCIMELGESVTLIESVLPDDATDKSVTWSSDNEGVATVVDGVVTAIAVGSANITATTNDGSKISSSCYIVVSIPTSDIPNNVIYYSSCNDSRIIPYNENFGPESSIVSNICLDKKGIITFTGDVQWIGKEAFYNCSDLTNIVIPKSTTTISTAAFSGCSNLKNLEIPDAVNSIGTSAFSGCSSLVKINIPSNVNSIGSYAFYGCFCLKDLYVNKKKPLAIDSDIFSDVDKSGITLHVPAGTKSLYETTPVWKDFGTVVEMEPEIIICTSISMIPTTSLEVGATETLTATVLPEDATDKSVTWSSDNESVATVADGVVTAVAAGTANITAKTNDGSNLSATCVVTVTSKSSGDDPSEDIEPSTDISGYTNVLYINDVEAKQGSELSLPLNMKNAEENITAFECKVYLPEGVEWAYTIDKRGNKIFVQPTFNEERTDANYHTINSIKQMEDGGYYVIVYSDKKEIILDKDGAILYMPLTVSEEIEPADYNIFVKDIVIVNENTEQVLIDKTVSKLTVPSYTIGDANDDGMINITDVVAVISYMLKESPNPFIFKAADVNCDEMINVTDVVGIIDIMTSGASSAKPEMAMAKKAVKKSAKTGNSLEIVPFTVAAGTTSMNVALELNNPGDEFTALECKVFLPEGVDWDYTIDRRGNKIYKQPTFNEDRTDANYHTINSISKVDGGYYVIVYSDKKEIFLDEDGALLYLPLVFDENINPGVYDIRVGDIVLARPDVTQELLDDYTASVLVGSPEIASLSLNGDFTAKAIGEYNTALASNTKVAAMDFSNATDVDATTAIATGNRNLLVYVAEGKSIANEDNAVIGDQCANLVLTDGHSFCAPKSFTATKASYERAASSNYGTLCLPFAPKSAASELYELTSSTESQLMFSAVASPAANTPYLYKSDTGKIAESNVEVVAEDAGNTMNGIWTMTGTYTMQTFSASDNVFALYEGKLYKNVGTLTMNPFRAYFTTESSASKAEVFIETPTGIESITGSQSIGNGNMFNVQGLRVNENYKGVKIINGKKYVK